MRRMLLLALALMFFGMVSGAHGQQATPSDESLAARARELEKTVQAQKLRIRRLEQQLRTRDEEVHMLVKIVSKQSDKEAKDSTEEGNTGADSSTCEPNPVVRVRTTRSAPVKAARATGH